MQSSQIPVKFPEIWGKNADPANIRAIPTTTATPGAASLDVGWPPLNFQPPAAGGIPPFGKDSNGILNQITAWTQWQNAGALTVYDGTFQTTIGGYPRGAILASAAGGGIWLSTTENNLTDPDTGGAGWVALVTSADAQSQKWNWAGTFGGTADALTATLSPGPAALSAGLTVAGLISGNNTLTSATLNLNGLGTRPILPGVGGPIYAGILAAGAVVEFTYDGTSWQFTNNLASFSGTGAVVKQTSPGLLGSPTAPTQSTGDSSTKIATTALVDAKIAANVYAGSNNTNTSFPIGTTVFCGSADNRNANVTMGLSADPRAFTPGGTGVAGTWSARGWAQPGGGNVTMYQRIS